MERALKHKFPIGATVHFTASNVSRPAATGTYEIIRLLPTDGDDCQYRIKSSTEAFERVAKESQLRCPTVSRPIAGRSSRVPLPVRVASARSVARRCRTDGDARSSGNRFSEDHAFVSGVLDLTFASRSRGMAAWRMLIHQTSALASELWRCGTCLPPSKGPDCSTIARRVNAATWHSVLLNVRSRRREGTIA